ncbi:hypothetical protein PMAC_000633 [Pneumocystis sp. 'macacae']|nr:hypothetical protein PMAC_000633 [Pneumocystis sp. 'macacae']
MCIQALALALCSVRLPAPALRSLLGSAVANPSGPGPLGSAAAVQGGPDTARQGLCTTGAGAAETIRAQNLVRSRFHGNSALTLMHVVNECLEQSNAVGKEVADGIQVGTKQKIQADGAVGR